AEPPDFGDAIVQDVPGAEHDRSRLMEGRLRLVEQERGVEHRLAAGNLLECALNTFRTDGGDQRRARRRQSEAQFVEVGRGCASAELKRVGDRLHRDARDRGTCVMALAAGESLTIADDWGLGSRGW